MKLSGFSALLQKTAGRLPAAAGEWGPLPAVLLALTPCRRAAFMHGGVP